MLARCGSTPTLRHEVGVEYSNNINTLPSQWSVRYAKLAADSYFEVRPELVVFRFNAVGQLSDIERSVPVKSMEILVFVRVIIF